MLLPLQPSPPQYFAGRTHPSPPAQYWHASPSSLFEGNSTSHQQRLCHYWRLAQRADPMSAHGEAMGYSHRNRESPKGAALRKKQGYSTSCPKASHTHPALRVPNQRRAESATHHPPVHRRGPNPRPGSRKRNYCGTDTLQLVGLIAVRLSRLPSKGEKKERTLCAPCDASHCPSSTNRKRKVEVRREGMQ